MKSVDSKSWILSTANDQAVHVWLYVRDVFRLEAISAEVPPSLDDIDLVPDVEMSSSERNDLSLAWLLWWRRLIHATGANHLGSQDGDQLARIVTRRPIFDWFDGFESLADFPTLRSAAQRTWKQGIEWTNAHAAKTLRRDWAIPKNVAELVMQEHQVPPERVRAAVLVMAVKGEWSFISDPGVLLCSEETFFDDALFAVELKRTFESGLGVIGQH